MLLLLCLDVHALKAYGSQFYVSVYVCNLDFTCLFHYIVFRSIDYQGCY